MLEQAGGGRVEAGAIGRSRLVVGAAGVGGGRETNSAGDRSKRNFRSTHVLPPACLVSFSSDFRFLSRSSPPSTGGVHQGSGVAAFGVVAAWS